MSLTVFLFCPPTATAQTVAYNFQSAASPFAPSTQNGVTATDFTATSGTLSQQSGGVNLFAKIAQSGSNPATGTFTITATQTVMLGDLTLQIGKTSGGPAADLDFALAGTNAQSFSLAGVVPSSTSDPGATPVVTVDFADFTLSPGQVETFTFSVTTNWSGASPGLLMDNITVTPVPEPGAGLTAAAAAAALAVGWFGRRARRGPAPCA